MRNISTLLAFVFLLFTHSNAQEECTRRFQDQIFKSVEFTGNVQFGSWFFPNGNEKKLHYDVYAPKDDTATLRPLIILWHGGAFMDLFTKSSPDIVTMAKDLAKRGYVVISPDYRGIRDVTDFFSKKELVKEVVGAAIDGHKAVCHIISQIDDGGNPFRINKNEIFAGGVSGGAVLGLHLILLKQTEDLPTDLIAWAREVDNGALDDVLANKFCGDPNIIKGFISISGALIDSSFITYSPTFFMHSHGKKDEIVPYNIGQPLNGLTAAPDLYGSKPIHEKMVDVGITSTFMSYDNAGHVPFLNLTLETLLQNFNIVNKNIYEETMNTTVDLIFDHITCEKAQKVTGIRNQHIQPIQIYPNPTHDMIQVQLPSYSKWNVSIMDTKGSTVQNFQFEGNQSSQSLSNISKGMYVIKISNLLQTDDIYIGKIIKQD